jgi:hypothetical protein
VNKVHVCTVREEGGSGAEREMTTKFSSDREKTEKRKTTSDGRLIECRQMAKRERKKSEQGDCINDGVDGTKHGVMTRSYSGPLGLTKEVSDVVIETVPPS